MYIYIYTPKVLQDHMLDDVNTGKYIFDVLSIFKVSIYIYILYFIYVYSIVFYIYICLNVYKLYHMSSNFYLKPGQVRAHCLAATLACFTLQRCSCFFLPIPCLVACSETRDKQKHQRNTSMPCPQATGFKNLRHSKETHAIVTSS